MKNVNESNFLLQIQKNVYLSPLLQKKEIFIENSLTNGSNASFSNSDNIPQIADQDIDPVEFDIQF